MPDQPHIPDAAIEAGRAALVRCGILAGSIWVSEEDDTVRGAAQLVVEGAAPHIAVQERAQVARDLLDTADDERARPIRDCCSMAIEAAYRDAAELVGRLGSAAPTLTEPDNRHRDCPAGHCGSWALHNPHGDCPGTRN